jgi:hypothetical protein
MALMWTALRCRIPSSLSKPIFSFNNGSRSRLRGELSITHVERSGRSRPYVRPCAPRKAVTEFFQRLGRMLELPFLVVVGDEERLKSIQENIHDLDRLRGRVRIVPVPV